MRVRWLGALGVLAVGACSSDEVDLLVDLKTDYVPGVEFAFVRGYLVRGDAQIATPPACVSGSCR